MNGEAVTDFGHVPISISNREKTIVKPVRGTEDLSPIDVIVRINIMDLVANIWMNVRKIKTVELKENV